MRIKDPPDRKRLKELYRYEPNSGLFYHLIPRGGAKIGDVAGTTLKSGRVQICVDQERHHGHRLAWFYEYGTWPVEIDHKDRNPANNRIKNLREAGRSQNIINSQGWDPHKKKHKLPRGVFKLKNGRFGARIGVNYTIIYLGTSETIEGAEAAYKEAARKYFGEFAP